MTPSSERECLSAQDKHDALALARAALTHAVRFGDRPTAEDLGIEIAPALEQQMGVFVTLKKAGGLRGCIGEIVPSRPLYEAVMAQAVNAGLNDPRFPPVDPSELDDIMIDISAYASAPTPVDSYHDIVLGQHGIVLDKHGRRALFLPQVAPEQGWDLETTLTHLAMKAGLGPNDWKEGAQFSVFGAIVFGEDEA